MDAFSLIYYAVICACLGLAAPWLGRALPRLLTGLALGIVAAAALPILRPLIGF